RVSQTFPDWIATGEHAIGDGFSDDYNRRRICCSLASIKRPPGNQWNSKCLEVVVADDTTVRLGLLSRLRNGIAVNVESRCITTVQRQNVDRARARDAR